MCATVLPRVCLCATWGPGPIGFSETTVTDVCAQP